MQMKAKKSTQEDDLQYEAFFLDYNNTMKQQAVRLSVIISIFLDTRFLSGSMVCCDTTRFD